MAEGHRRANEIAERMATWMLHHRVVTSLLVLVPTIILGIKIPTIEVYSRFADLLPQQHSFIENYNRMKDTFGGANVVTMSLEANEGDIFTKKTLEKVRMLTEEVDLITGVNHYQVASIAHPKIRRLRTTAGGLIKSEPVLPKEIPSTEEGLKELREAMYNNDVVYGTYVSEDGEAALIRAGFDEERLNYSEIFTRLRELREQVEADGETRLYITGEPMLKGWIYHYSSQLWTIFGVTLAIIVGLLFFHFRSVVGVMLPLIGTGMSAIWGLGFVGWLGYNLDPLVLVVPILISARTASHCVQMVERYLDELRSGQPRFEAARVAMGELMLPAAIAIFTDAAGLLVLSVASIPLIRNLGIFCSFWSFSNLFTVPILMPLLLTVLPTPRTAYARSWSYSLATRLMEKIAGFLSSPRSTVPVLGLALLIVVGAIWQGAGVTVGEESPGSPILFPDSDYNVAAAHIADEFAGANQFSVYLEGDRRHIMKDPRVVRKMEEFRLHMTQAEKAGGTRDIPTLVRSVNRLYHFDDPRWSALPSTPEEIGNILFLYEAGAAVPGVIQEYMDLEGQTANFVTFFKDRTGETVHTAIEQAESFVKQNPIEGVEYRFAGGIVGVTAAQNQEVERSELLQTSLIIIVVMLSVLLTYRSPAAAGLVFVVLAMAVIVNRAYMGMRGIGLNVNTLPVTAVGIGVGVDYAIYVLDRIKEEVRRRSLPEALRVTLSTTGVAVVFTAVTVVGGVVYWIPGSDLRFNSEMAMLLSLLMVSNMIGAVTILPLLIRVLRPRFVMREAEHAEAEGEKAEPSTTSGSRTEGVPSGRHQGRVPG